MGKLRDKINSIILAILPLLAVYMFTNGVNYANLIVLFFAPINLLPPIRNIMKDPIWILFIMVTIIGIIALANPWGDYSLYIHNLFPFLVFFFCIAVVTKRIDINLFTRTVIFVALIVSIICIFQRLELVATGRLNHIFYIPGMELAREVETITIRRPSAFFTEPAHLAIYLLPAFYLSLLYNRALYSAIFGLAILASGSSTGFIIILILLAYKYLLKLNVKRILQLAILLTIIGYLIHSYAPTLIDDNVDKISNDNLDSNIRLLGSLYVIDYFTAFQHLFGIGLNHLESFCRYTLGTIGVKNYSNAILYTYISYGIIGLFALITYLYKLWYSIGSDKGFILILICALMSDQILFNTNLTYLLSFVVLTPQISKIVSNPRGQQLSANTPDK